MQRKTQQRQAIQHALETADRPLSPQEILDTAATGVPGLGIATVYRTIRGFLDEGRLHAVELPGAPARYELAGKHHHHHFHCRHCDGVFEIEHCPDNFADLAPPGFRAERHEIILYGLCGGCAAHT